MIQAAMNDNRHIQHSLGLTANRGTLVFATLQDAAYLDRHYRIYGHLVRTSSVVLHRNLDSSEVHQGAGGYPIKELAFV
jgi:hypothetical protein